MVLQESTENLDLIWLFTECILKEQNLAVVNLVLLRSVIERKVKIEKIELSKNLENFLPFDIWTIINALGEPESLCDFFHYFL